jgi:drug/metabolite transporter (DMT)-like permease
LAAIVDFLVPILAALFIVAAVLFFARGILARSSVSESSYGVERQEARHGMLIAFARGVAMVILALILLAVFGLSSRPESTVDVTEAPPVTLPATPTVTVSPTDTATPLPALGPSPTSPLPTPTEEPLVTPAPSPTTGVATAVVSSPNGLWLREAPGGNQQIELIPDGTSLTLLPSVEEVDGLAWQEVLTPAGNEGWVAAEFIVYQ